MLSHVADRGLLLPTCTAVQAGRTRGVCLSAQTACLPACVSIDMLGMYVGPSVRLPYSSNPSKAKINKGV